jgi:hypothetical protein
MPILSLIKKKEGLRFNAGDLPLIALLEAREILQKIGERPTCREEAQVEQDQAAAKARLTSSRARGAN